MKLFKVSILTARLWEMERELQRGLGDMPTPYDHSVPTRPHISPQNPGNWKAAKLSSCPAVLGPREVLGRMELQVLEVRGTGEQAGAGRGPGRLVVQQQLWLLRGHDKRAGSLLCTRLQAGTQHPKIDSMG